MGRDEDKRPGKPVGKIFAAVKQEMIQGPKGRQ